MTDIDSLVSIPLHDDNQDNAFRDINIALTSVCVLQLDPGIRNLIFSLVNVPDEFKVSYEITGLFDLNFSYPNQDVNDYNAHVLNAEEELTIQAVGSGVLQIAIFDV